MKYPTKHAQFAYDLGVYVACALVGTIGGVALGWAFAHCMLSVIR